MLQRIERQESRIRVLEERLASLTQPSELLTEKQAAKLLGVCMKTMWNWWQGRQPLIEFIDYPGRGVRYRREDIEQFLQSFERGAKKGLAK